MGHIQYGNHIDPMIITYNAECLMKPEFPHSVLFVKFRQGRLHRFRGAILPKLLRQVTDPFTDTAVIHLAFPLTAIVIQDKLKFPCIQAIHHPPEIIIVPFLKYGNVVKYRAVDRPLHFPSHFTGQAVTIFVIYKKIRQIAVPQVPVKTVVSCHFQQPVHAAVQQGTVFLPFSRSLQTPVGLSAPAMFHQPDHIIQKFSVFRFPVYQ